MKTDQLKRFIFEKLDIRGEIVQLGESWQQILSTHEYPPLIRQYLGEMMVATTLLAATLKIDGSLTIQASGRGALNLMLTECRSDLSIRAIAKYNSNAVDEFNKYAGELERDLPRFLKDGTLVITIEQKNGQRYQGIVAIKGQTIAEMLEHHLLQSEQLKTRLFLSAGDQVAAGLLLQELPANKNRQQDWQELEALLNTLTDKEIQTLDAQTIIHRLFHQHDVRQFEPNPVSFRCNCSRERVSQMLLSLDYQQAREMIEQSEFIEVGCEFCNRQYRFDELDITELFTRHQKPTYH